MIARSCSFVCIVLLVCLSPDRARAQTAAYLDPDLPLEVRVDDLVGRMTLEEKVSQMLDQAPAIERLGIPEYNWWNEALHGVARSGLATVFPQAIGLAATWNEPLIHRMATVISDEARAKHHEYVRRGSRMRYQGLTIWSPNINLFRDPRWGRGQETYGEDPHLTGRLGAAFIKGLQGDDPHYLKTVATVKHFAVHSGPEPERHTFDAVVNERDFREWYLPHFRTGIQEGGAYSLMCAYNRVNGEAACGSGDLLNGLLRSEWGFDGYVVSDCWALDDIFQNHRVVATAPEAAALAVKSGTDLDCGSLVFPKLTEAVALGLVEESVIDEAVKRLFRARFKLGMFDPVERVAYAQIPYSILDQPSHKALAREVARQSIVLLKNDGVLPLRKDLGSLAVIGPNADQWLMLLGNYNGVPSDPVTPLRGIRKAVSPGTAVRYARGSDLADGFPLFERVPDEVFSTGDGALGLSVTYWNGNNPEKDPLFTATDSRLDANWTDGAPRADMNPDDFAVRWTAMLHPERTGAYRLGAIATMKFEIYLDDSLLVRSRYHFRDELGDPRVIASEHVMLEAGRAYRLRVDATETYGEAAIQLIWTAQTGDLEEEAVHVARQSDAVVLFLGLTPQLEGEEMRVDVDGFRGGDRTRIDLPDAQKRLLERVVAVGKPTVLVLLNGSALAVPWAQEHVSAIVEAWYPGQAAGDAIADVLFGDYNPAGRLPVTFYQSVDDLPPFEDYSTRGRTYRYVDGEPLYPFGHGLSYTTFGYANLRTSSEVLVSGETVTVHLDVTNMGERSGDEVVQLYVQYPESAVERPIRELRGFARIALNPGHTKTVELPLSADDLRYWDPDRSGWVLEPGTITLQVGASSADIRLQEALIVRP